MKLGGSNLERFHVLLKIMPVEYRDSASHVLLGAISQLVDEDTWFKALETMIDEIEERMDVKGNQKTTMGI